MSIEEKSKEINFGQRLKDFMEKYNLSSRKVETICKNAPNTSNSSVNRFQLGKANPKIYDETLLIFEIKLREWMFEQGYSNEKIEEELENLFRFEEREMIINRTELTAAAVKFFGLTADPFDVDRVPGEDEMFSNDELDEAARRVRDAVLYKRLICITGNVGTGKTSLKIRVARELEESNQKTRLIFPEFFDMNAVNVGAIAATILDEFEISVPRAATTRVRRIRQQLSSLEKDDVKVALVFDECHRLNEKVIISLKNFWEMTNGAYSRLLGIVLFGQPKFVETTLRDYKFREIAERIQIIQMPEIAKSAADYLAHKLKSVGGDIDELFEPEAVRRICTVAKTPLALGNLANNSLMEAFKEYAEKRVTSQMLHLPDAPRLLGRRAA